jgi:hypothetical protein
MSEPIVADAKSESFAGLLDQVPGERGVPSLDQRRAQRMPLKARLAITPCPHGMPSGRVSIETRDYSPRGIRFAVPRRVTAGDSFILHLTDAQTGREKSVLCRIVHAMTEDEKSFTVGAEFICILPPGALTATPEAPSRELIERLRKAILN